MWRYSRSTCWSTILLLVTTCLPSLLGGLLLLLCLIEFAVTVLEGLHFCMGIDRKAVVSGEHAVALSIAEACTCLTGTPVSRVVSQALLQLGIDLPTPLCVQQQQCSNRDLHHPE